MEGIQKQSQTGSATKNLSVFYDLRNASEIFPPSYATGSKGQYNVWDNEQSKQQNQEKVQSTQRSRLQQSIFVEQRKEQNKEKNNQIMKSQNTIVAQKQKNINIKDYKQIEEIFVNSDLELSELVKINQQQTHSNNQLLNKVMLSSQSASSILQSGSLLYNTHQQETLNYQSYLFKTFEANEQSSIQVDIDISKLNNDSNKDLSLGKISETSFNLGNQDSSLIIRSRSQSANSVLDNLDNFFLLQYNQDIQKLKWIQQQIVKLKKILLPNNRMPSQNKERIIVLNQDKQSINEKWKNDHRIKVSFSKGIMQNINSQAQLLKLLSQPLYFPFVQVLYLNSRYSDNSVKTIPIISDEALKQFSQHGQKFSNLKQIHLYNNKITDHGFSAFTTNSFRYFNLQKINFKGNQITDKSFIKFTQNSQNFSNLKSISFSSNKISDNGFNKFIQTKQFFEKLESIDFSSNLMTNASFILLAMYGQNYLNLKSINFGGNKISDQGLQDFSSHGENFSHLRLLLLRQNMITDKGFKSLVQNGLYFKQLQAINLQSNLITIVGLTYLVENLQKRFPNQKRINLRYNKFEHLELYTLTGDNPNLTGNIWPD